MMASAKAETEKMKSAAASASAVESVVPASEHSEPDAVRKKSEVEEVVRKVPKERRRPN